MSTVHIYAPACWLGRTVHHCTTCRKRRRFIVRLFEWHPAEWDCGGCGHTFVSGEGRQWASKKARAERIDWVRDNWPSTLRLKAVISEMLDSVRSE